MRDPYSFVPKHLTCTGRRDGTGIVHQLVGTAPEHWLARNNYMDLTSRTRGKCGNSASLSRQSEIRKHRQSIKFLECVPTRFEQIQIVLFGCVNPAMNEQCLPPKLPEISIKVFCITLAVRILAPITKLTEIDRKCGGRKGQ